MLSETAHWILFHGNQFGKNETFLAQSRNLVWGRPFLCSFPNFQGPVGLWALNMSLFIIGFNLWYLRKQFFWKFTQCWQKNVIFVFIVERLKKKKKEKDLASVLRFNIYIPAKHEKTYSLTQIIFIPFFILACLGALIQGFTFQPFHGGLDFDLKDYGCN